MSITSQAMKKLALRKSLYSVEMQENKDQK